MSGCSKLILANPANSFVEGLPIGSGRLAAMIHGTLPLDRIDLNHEELWSARHRAAKECVNARDVLPEIRQLVRDGKFDEATRLANYHLSPHGGISGVPGRIDSYSTAGYLGIESEDNYGNYRRELDLESGMVVMRYLSRHLFYGGRDLKREYFASLTDGRIYIRLSAGNAPFDGACRLDRTQENQVELDYSVDASSGSMSMRGVLAGGRRFEVAARLFADIALRRNNNRQLLFNGATSLVIVVDVAVDGVPIELPDHVDFDGVFAEHRNLYRERFLNRFALDIEFGDDDHSGEPLEERLENLRHGATDPGLALLYFHYGRYLLFASSSGRLPPTLQGKWCADIYPPWQCDYHLNINLQMAMWGADPTNLSDLNLRLFNYLDRLAVDGRRVAREMWNCRGLWLPHCSDYWAQATPEACGWSIWIGAAPWLAGHYFNYYEYTLDLDFLRDRAWPFLRDAAIFFEDFLVAGEDGRLSICPSQSPENRFVGGGDMPVTTCSDSACDIEMVAELLRNAVKCATILNIAPESVAKWQSMIDLLPPLRIGSDGRLLEWNCEVEEVEPGHRHVSHLYAVWPGRGVNGVETPELFAAARKSLEFRLAHHGGHTGWSQAWTANFYAAFGDGELVYRSLVKLATEQSSNSLLDLHPPKLFQIDGNLGIISAVTTMLADISGGVLTLLPALPPVWRTGSVRNLKLRGGFSLDMRWRDNEVVAARLFSTAGNTIRVARRNCVTNVATVAGSYVDLV